jgi:hypothetical protein
LTYGRPPGTKLSDFENARDFENEVADSLPAWKRTEFNSNDRLDIWIPENYVECKEKRQPLSKRWHLLDGVDEVNHFVMDELSVRRACRHWPSAFFVIRDVPGGNRLFVISIVELVCVERVRVNRKTSDTHMKGKWLIDLSECYRLGHLAELHPYMQQYLLDTPWKKSPCLGKKEVRSL